MSKSSKHAPVIMPPVAPRWDDGRTVIVAAPGPSLTQEVAERCKGHTCLAIKEAYRLIPWADVCYGCDAKFWLRTQGCPDYQGEKWSSHDDGSNNKLAAARDYGVKLCNGKAGSAFSLDPGHIHYGSNSGFQAINLTILFGATRIVLVGFDMRVVDGRRYFCKPHPTQAGQRIDYGKFSEIFGYAARKLPPTIKIINCTPNSALRAFPLMSLEDGLTSHPT
jgi:hypothetical protein